MVQENKVTKKDSALKDFISWVVILGLAFLIGTGINNYVLMKAEIPSGSMENTLQVGDKLFGFRLAYLFSDPERRDIVMFDYPDDESKLYVKRIIGLPGETVEIIDGTVYIWSGDKEEDKIVLDEPYLKEKPKGSFGPFEVPEGCYFMMGDNRNGSWDSRMWDNKFVEKEKIQCKAWLRYKPDFSFVK